MSVKSVHILDVDRTNNALCKPGFVVNSIGTYLKDLDLHRFRFRHVIAMLLSAREPFKQRFKLNSLTDDRGRPAQVLGRRSCVGMLLPLQALVS